MCSLETIIRKSILNSPDDQQIWYNFITNLTTASTNNSVKYGQINTFESTNLGKYNQRVGRLWEEFCQGWLETTGHLGITGCLLLDEIDPEWLEYLGLTSKDIGIDLIAWTGDPNHDDQVNWFPIQAKFRTNFRKSARQPKVSWSDLSTFFGLVARTGPPQGWYKHIIMTNCAGVKWVIPKTTQDLTLAMGSFKKTPRQIWLKLANFQPNQLAVPTTQPETIPTTLPELRAARLKYYS